MYRTSLGLVLNLLRPFLMTRCFSFSARTSLCVHTHRERESQNEAQYNVLVVSLVQGTQLVVNVYDLSPQFLESRTEARKGD